jgi:hypothetical protein
VLVVGATWRLTGLPAAGRSLVASAAAGAETERTLAGMLLVRAGDRSVPVVSDGIRAGRDPAVLVDVLAGIGTDHARAALRRLSQAPDTTGASCEAAAEALRTLDEIRRDPDGR